VKTNNDRPYFNKLLAEVRARQPRFVYAVVQDAKRAADARGERFEFRNRADAALQVLRLMCVSDAFVGQVFYRAQARLDALGVPVLPWVAKRIAMMTAQICIGRSVLLHPGVLLAHGQVVIDGFVEIHKDAVIFSWVSIGLRSGKYPGPTIERNVRVGTGAKVLGPITLHADATVGANAVVLEDVPAGVTVVGVPARPL
jgi:serine O-acetyltransferase